MRRREFIVLLGSAVAWPLTAPAQQVERMRHIGVLMNTAADDTVFQIRVGAFLQGLALLGWTIGRNVRIEIRWSGGKADDARRYAAELVAFAPDVILAHGVSTRETVAAVARASRLLTDLAYWPPRSVLIPRSLNINDLTKGRIADGVSSIAPRPSASRA